MTDEAARQRLRSEAYAGARELLERALALMDHIEDGLVAAQIAFPIETIARRCEWDDGER